MNPCHFVFVLHDVLISSLDTGPVTKCLFSRFEFIILPGHKVQRCRHQFEL